MYVIHASSVFLWRSSDNNLCSKELDAESANTETSVELVWRAVLCTRTGRTAAAAVAAAVAKSGGGEEPRGGTEWVKGRCELKLMVKRSMGTVVVVVAAAAARSSWLVHEDRGEGIIGEERR